MEPDQEYNIHELIDGRNGHIAVHYKDRMLVWGGFQEPEDRNAHNLYHPTEEVLIYNSFTEVWCKLVTTGDIPEPNTGACGLVLDEFFYIFGGFSSRVDTWFDHTNDLYRLDMKTLCWTKLQPGGIVPTECSKFVGWTYRNKLYFFGGFCPAPQSNWNIPFTYVRDGHLPRGFNNQFLCYDPDLNEWSYPETKGITPPARAAHATDIIGNKVYMFGGMLRNLHLQSLHCLDMDLMEWSPEIYTGDVVPEGRSCHSFTFVNENTAIMYGGFSKKRNLLKDCWELNLQTLRWKICDVKDKTKFRVWYRWHQAVFLPSVKTLVITGGHTIGLPNPDVVRSYADYMFQWSFEPKSLFRLCLDAAVKNSQVTQPHWNELPLDQQKILDSRLKQLI